MKKRSRPTTKAEETPEFVAFWTIWQPHMNVNDGRGSARNEFFRHVEEYGADPKDIVDGAAWFIRCGGNQRKPNGDLFQLHAQSWLNKMAYEDGCEKERAFQARQTESQSNVVNINRPQPRSKWAMEYEARKQAAE